MNKARSQIAIVLFFISQFFGQNTPPIDNLIQNAISAQKLANPEPRKYSQAKSLESAGLLDEAEKVYKDLNQQYPGISKYFRPLRNLLKQKEDFKTLEEFSLQFVDANPTDAQGWVDLAEVYIWWEKPEKWQALYDDLLTNRSKDENLIKMMVGRLVVNGLTDEGVEYLHKFRYLSGNPQFYSLEMGTYFSLQMSWENSIDEYLNYLSGRSPQFSIVSERILSMPEDENIQSMIRQKLETSPLSDAKFILSDLYFKNREFKKAYDVLISNHASDERLLKFGDDLLFVKEFDLADSVMNNILLTSKDEKVLESAIFKIAQIYEDRTLRSLNLLPISGLFRGNQFFASPFLRIDESQSLAIYKAMSIYDSLKTVTNSIEAAFKLGEIRFRALNDLDGAENQFNELILISGTHPFKLKSFIRTIDILLAKGDLSGAETKITDALKNSSFVRSLGRDANSELEMKLMQVYFYEGKLEELDSLSAIMMKNLPSGNDRVNDILELSGLSISLKNNEDFFNQFAEVQLKIHQNKRTEAIRSLQELTEIEKSPNIGLVYYQYAQLLLLQGETSRTLEMLDLIPGDSPYASLGLIMKGEVEDYILNDLSTSIDTYLLFLEKYPDSIYYDDIRMRLRELAS